MPMRVVSSELDPHRKDSDVSGAHTVLYPTSDGEVKEALVVAKAFGVRKLLVRSGRHAAENTAVDGKDAIVVNLRQHSDIKIDGRHNVTVCAGATTSDLAIKLKEHNLFLPLDGNPDKSVLSNVRSTEQGFVPAFSLGTFLTGTQGINKESMEFVENVEIEREGAQEDHIVTRMVFKAKTADEVEGYRMTRRCFTYSRDVLGDVLRHVFFAENRVVARDKIDVRVTTFTGVYGMPLFTVTAAGPQDSNYVAEMLQRLDPGGDVIVEESTVIGESDPMINDAPARRQKVVMSTGMVNGADIVEAVAEEGKGSQYRYEKHRTRYVGELTEHQLNGYADAVHRAVAFRPAPLLPDVKISSTVRWIVEDGVARVGVDMSLYAPPPQHQTSAEKNLHCDFEEAIHNRSRETRALQVDLGRPAAGGKLVGLDVGKRVDTAIPGFTGEVYSPGMHGYADKNEQYATSSYTDESYRMTPCAIGYAENIDDVKAFVGYAIAKSKKVVVRSGGHQYCGLSSGGSNTMLLSMDLLKEINVEVLETGEVMAHTGPGVQLLTLATTLKENNVTIPHGECPEVCIGGHVQTGGYGHLMRSFGLALDHVKSFDIVLVHPTVELRTIQRPTHAVQDDNSSSDDDRIFWGVMGGGAGSFGVITNIVFECIKDADHPSSCGYQGSYLYLKSVCKAAMTVVQKRTEDVFNRDALPRDCDLMVTVVSSSLWHPTHPASVGIEMVHGNCNGLALSDEDAGLARMKAEIDEIKASKPGWVPGPYVTFDPSSSTPLSYMNRAFVRTGSATYDGREFRFPYIKRMSCTLTALSDEFVDAFVDLIHKAMLTPHVKLVFQMGMGGGAYKRNGCKGLTSIPHRDIVIGIGFDLFYASKGKAAANDLHNEFGALMPIFSSEDIRMAWCSFGEIDMDLVHDEYYGSGNGLYERLQKLKQEVDPLDHFHTPFTVQLPSPQADGRDADKRAGKRAKRKH